MVLQMSPAKAAVYGYLGPGGTAVSVSVASGGNELYTVRLRALAAGTSASAGSSASTRTDIDKIEPPAK